MALTIRRAVAADAVAVAEVHLRSRASAGDAIPPSVHPDDELRAHVAETVIPTRETWLAEWHGAPAGVLVLEGDDLDWLWVDPDFQGRGIGSALLQQAQTLRPDGLALWVFTSNLRARRFYEARGWRAVRATDGDNEERAPDIRYVWGDHPEG